MLAACGIDFGTSNSTVGWCRPGQSSLLELEEGKATLPSVVFFNAEDDAVTFGRQALRDYLEGYEGRLMRSLKSLLGTSLIDAQTEVQGRALPYRDLLTFFIRELKRRAEQAAGQDFAQAVFGRPVHFVDDDTAADRRAQDTLEQIARAVGFRDVLFQYEPIAAAYDYESGIGGEELVLVVDVGGGTSDFTLVRLSPKRARQAERRDDILANGGVHIGGTDFDKYLSLHSAMPLLGLGTRLASGAEVPSSVYFNLATWHTINLAYTQKVWRELQDIHRDACERGKLALLLQLVDQRDGHWLALKAEEAKIALSDTDTAVLQLERLAGKPEQTLDRKGFNLAVAHLVENIETTVSAMLRDAAVDASAIDTVFFTGGSSGVHLLREKISALLPGARRVEGDLFGSIGTGLALDAQRRYA